jgi:hypothetical protein
MQGAAGHANANANVRGVAGHANANVNVWVGALLR